MAWAAVPVGANVADVRWVRSVWSSRWARYWNARSRKLFPVPVRSPIPYAYTETFRYRQAQR